VNRLKGRLVGSIPVHFHLIHFHVPASCPTLSGSLSKRSASGIRMEASWGARHSRADRAARPVSSRMGALLMSAYRLPTGSLLKSSTKLSGPTVSLCHGLPCAGIRPWRGMTILFKFDQSRFRSVLQDIGEWKAAGISLAGLMLS
jgi:hypothetical protein